MNGSPRFPTGSHHGWRAQGGPRGCVPREIPAHRSTGPESRAAACPCDLTSRTSHSSRASSRFCPLGSTGTPSSSWAGWGRKGFCFFAAQCRPERRARHRPRWGPALSPPGPARHQPLGSGLPLLQALPAGSKVFGKHLGVSPEPSSVPRSRARPRPPRFPGEGGASLGAPA